MLIWHFHRKFIILIKNEGYGIIYDIISKELKLGRPVGTFYDKCTLVLHAQILADV